MERKQNWKSDLILRGRKDPAWWIENVLGDHLWSRQIDVCKSVAVHERTAVVACVDKDTEILTETRGWQLFKDLLITDKVASLVNEQLVFVSPLDYFEGDYDGELIGCKNDYIDFLVTPNHRCLVSTGADWVIREASELLDEDGVFFKTPTDVCVTHVVSSQRNDFYKQKYIGKIYCVQVQSGIILIRRNNLFYWIGNSFGVGKTHLAARLALWFLCCFKPSKVVSTAPCFDDETEILTDFGWKLFKDLNKQEKVASLVDGELKFVTPLDWMQYAVEGELLGYKGRDLDFLVTPQHKLYTHRHYETEFSLVRADEVYGKWDYRFNRHCVWEGVDDDFTEDAYELFGFWMADGSAFYNEQRRAYGICITQSKHVLYVEDLLTKVGFKYSKESKKQYDNYLISIDKKGLQGYNFVVYSKDVASWFIDNFGRLKIDRRCPQWLRNAPIYKLKAFLRGFMLADGCEQKDSKRIRVYGNKGLADDLQEIGLKAGYVVNSHWQYCGNRPGATIEDSWALNFLNSDTKSKEFPATNKNHWYKKQYVGNVYCVEVPSNIILVRRNGVYHWSGNTLRQVKDLLWSELRTAHKNAIIPIGGELLQLSLKFDEDHFCVGFSTDAENMDKFTGLHQSNQLVIFDQAGGIDPNIWQAAEGLMTSANCKWLAISNSAISDGELANICMPDRKTRFGTWNVMRIKASESPNVLAGKNIIPGLVAHDWVKKREEAWGRDDPLYKIFVEAEFIPDSEMVVVPYNAVVAAFNSVGELGHSIEIGLDVARMGTDSTVWTAVSGSRVLEVKRITGNTTMQVVGETVEFVRHVQEKYGLPVVAVKIDVIGLGAGVYDRMIELADESIDIPVVAVNNAEVQIVVDKERYSNVRAEMAWAFRYRMEQGGVGLSVVFTHDYEIKDYIRGDIQAMRYKITSQGKIQLLPKDILKKALGRSPDYWDSLVMAFETPGGGIPSVEFLTNKEEKAEEFQISEEEWQVLMGTRVPMEGSHFIDFGF